MAIYQMEHIVDSGTSILKTLNSDIWVSVIQQEGAEPGVSYFMTLNATSDSCNSVLSAAANLITKTLKYVVFHLFNKCKQ